MKQNRASKLGRTSTASTVRRPSSTTAWADGAPKESLPVYAFDGETCSGFNALTDGSGLATFVRPNRSYLPAPQELVGFVREGSAGPSGRITGGRSACLPGG